MITASDIGWAGYGDFEGPFFRGTQKFIRPTDPTDADRVLEVISATEGGCYDSYNGYDGQYGSIGLIQCKEKDYHLLSELMCAAVSAASYSSPAVRALLEELDSMGLELSITPRRLQLKDKAFRRTPAGIFYGDSSGKRGTWNDSAKMWAKRLAAALCSLFSDPDARRGQRNYIYSILGSFATGGTWYYIADAKADGSPVALAFVAAYLSFAVNNPARAAKHFRDATSRARTVFHIEWLNEVLYELTFSPKIAIYPHRYNAIRPKLEELYGINLPDFAKDLEEWKKYTDHTILDPKEVQMALAALNYDIGPFGADGRFGTESKAALLHFQRDHKIKDPDGELDPETAKALEEALRTQDVRKS